eukprot:jgi/Botrbrau1/815/Bobra.0352s0012.1
MLNWTDPFNQPWIKKVGVMDASEALLWQALCTWPPWFSVSADLFHKLGKGIFVQC